MIYKVVAMSGMTERIYPNETNTESRIQEQMTELLINRYEVACRWLKEYLKDDNHRIIDIACGSGYGTAMLSGFGSIIGIDIDKEAVEYAKKYYNKKNITFLVGNADDFTYLEKLGKFDAVVSSGTIEHVEDELAFLDWIRKSLNPNGVCILGFPSTFTRDWAYPFHKRDISPRKAVKMINQAGFTILKEHFQTTRFRMKDLVYERDSNPSLPVPPLSHWFGYFLKRFDHLLRRVYQMSVGGGILFSDQQYLIKKTAE